MKNIESNKSVFSHYECLSSCKKSEKFNKQFLRKCVAYGRKEEGELIGSLWQSRGSKKEKFNDENLY